MTHTPSIARLIVVVGSLLVAGCSAPPEPSQPEPAQPMAETSVAAVKSPVSINAEMVRLVDHASHQLWDVEKEGMAPKSDADWENVVEHATQIAAAGALIRLEGTGVNDRDWVQLPDWQKWAGQVSDAGVAALAAAEAKDMDALVVANGQLVDACEGCHQRFKPAIPSEGINHVHVH